MKHNAHQSETCTHTHTAACIKDKINDIKQSHKYVDYVLSCCSQETNTPSLQPQQNPFWLEQKLRSKNLIASFLSTAWIGESFLDNHYRNLRTPTPRPRLVLVKQPIVNSLSKASIISWSLSVASLMQTWQVYLGMLLYCFELRRWHLHLQNSAKQELEDGPWAHWCWSH